MQADVLQQTPEEKVYDLLTRDWNGYMEELMEEREGIEPSNLWWAVFSITRGSLSFEGESQGRRGFPRFYLNTSDPLVANLSSAKFGLKVTETSGKDENARTSYRVRRAGYDKVAATYSIMQEAFNAPEVQELGLTFPQNLRDQFELVFSDLTDTQKTLKLKELKAERPSLANELANSEGIIAPQILSAFIDQEFGSLHLESGEIATLDFRISSSDMPLISSISRSIGGDVTDSFHDRINGSGNPAITEIRRGYKCQELLQMLIDNSNEGNVVTRLPLIRLSQDFLQSESVLNQMTRKNEQGKYRSYTVHQQRAFAAIQRNYQRAFNYLNNQLGSVALSDVDFSNSK